MTVLQIAGCANPLFGFDRFRKAASSRDYRHIPINFA